MFTELLIHEVTVWNPSEDVTDPDAEFYGDVKLMYAPDETVVARVQQGAKGGNEDADETIAGHDQRLTDLRVFLPSGTNITALSQLEWQGTMYRITGEPNIVDDSVGPHHIEANLMLVEGG